MADAPPRPVIVVTGANSGVGLGTCQRLLVQLSAPLPSDTEPRFALRDGPAALPSPFAAPHGCTLVLACRNPVKAHRARRELMALLEALGELPDEAQPTEAPRSRRLPKGSIDEDADPALAAQAVEASIRRRRRRGAAAAAATAEGQAQDALASGATSSALPPPKALDTYDETRDGDGASLSFAAREARARGVYRRRFVAGTRIEFVPLDLGSMASVLSCAKDITERCAQP
jgi:3-keto steroid reductase